MKGYALQWKWNRKICRIRQLVYFTRIFFADLRTFSFLIELQWYLISHREHMSSFSLYNIGSHCCGMNKILPADHFSSFLIQHYYQQRHVSWIPTYSTDYELHQNAREINCWNGIKAATLKAASNSPPFTNYSVISIPGQWLEKIIWIKLFLN